MADMSTIEMQDRELFAAMAMQALITRGEGWAADMIAKQAVTSSTGAFSRFETMSLLTAKEAQAAMQRAHDTKTGYKPPIG